METPIHEISLLDSVAAISRPVEALVDQLQSVGGTLNDRVGACDGHIVRRVADAHRDQ